MAILIDTVYQRVLAAANKEQRGYITPQEFNLMANQAQMSIFESYFYSKNTRDRLEPNAVKDPHTSETDISEFISKKLKPFTSIATVTSANTFPANYQTGKIYANGRVCRKVELNEIQRFATSLRHIGGQDPIYADSSTNGEDIVVYSPSALLGSGVTCEIISKPTAVAWGYVVVNEQALYNSNTTTDFLLHDSEEDTLVIKILELAGIILNKPTLTQLASGKDQVESQTQKQ